MVQGRTYIVVVDGIVGRGEVLRRGQVLAEAELWGMALVLEKYGAIATNVDLPLAADSVDRTDPPSNHYLL